jgi:hypothetical protein
MEAMKSPNQFVRINHVRFILAQACCLKRLEEDNLLGALLMVSLMIRIRVSSIFLQWSSFSLIHLKLRHLFSLPCI